MEFYFARLARLSLPSPKSERRRETPTVLAMMAAVCAALAPSATAQGGDTCASATTVVLPFNAGFDLTSATASGSNNGCNPPADFDRWITFVVPNPPGTTSAQIVLQHFQWPGGFPGYNWTYGLYRASSCGAVGIGTRVDCRQGAASETFATQVTAIPGEQYYLCFSADAPVLGVSFFVNVTLATECTTAMAVTQPGAIAFPRPNEPIATPFSCGAGFDRVKWYSYTARCSGVVEVSTCNSDFETVLEVYAGGPCGQLLACSDAGCGPHGLLAVPVVQGQSLGIRIGARSTSAGTGTLRVSEPALILNDRCALAQPIAEGVHELSAACLTGNFLINLPAPPCGTTSPLFPSAWFRYTVVNGGALSIDACGSDLPVTLVVSTGCPGTLPAATILHCSDQGCGIGGAVGLPFTGQALPGDELYIRLNVRSNAAPLAGTLRLVIDELDALGDHVCDGQPNSTGSGAVLSMSGSASTALDDLTLEVDQLPANSMGLFVTSQSVFTLMNPGGSQGHLCIASLSMGRYAPQSSGASGEASLPAGLASIPLGGGRVAGMSGETWYWQYWYRDNNPGATSNFSSARGLLLQ